LEAVDLEVEAEEDFQAAVDPLEEEARAGGGEGG
jgi:hypothetical protein